MIELNICDLELVSGAGCVEKTLNGASNGAQAGGAIGGAIGIGIAAGTGGGGAPLILGLGTIGAAIGAVGGGIAVGYECYKEEQERKEKDKSGNNYGH